MATGTKKTTTTKTTKKTTTKKKYEQVGVTSKIRAVSRCAVKIRDNFYTIEAEEERTISSPDADVEVEWKLLFDSVNAIVDDQCEQILDTFSK